MYTSSVPKTSSIGRRKNPFTSRIVCLGLCLLLIVLAEPGLFVVRADPGEPSGSAVLGEGFEGKTLDEWSVTGESDTNWDTISTGASGSADSALQSSAASSLWVDAVGGSDANDGQTAAAAFRTIQKAADLAGPGTKVHILPGVYRETVAPANSGNAGAPIIFVAENGPGTAIIRGSEPALSLTWRQLAANTIGLPGGVDPTNIYYADLSAWKLDKTPRVVVELDSKGEVTARLPVAYEPDWQVPTEWKYHEFWWAADGGWDVAKCDPRTDPDPIYCDVAWRSSTKLTDRTNDAEPAGVEPGNLATLGNLVGATIVAMGTKEGHYVYRRTIVAHDVAAGQVTVNRSCDNGLGWGSKYYVENHPALLDSPGEWWYDKASERLYLWPRIPGGRGVLNVEISRRDVGFDLSRRSYVTLDGVTVEFLNGSAVSQSNGGNRQSYHNTLRNVTLRYANHGVYMGQGADGAAGNITDGFTLENSEIAYVDTHGIYLNYWWENGSAPASFTHAGIVNTVIRGNELHHMGFRSDSDNAIGLAFLRADKLRLEDNYIHHVAHNGVQFSWSVIQSSKEWDFSPAEIKTGEILIKDNVFEKACQLTSDCGALKFWGETPDGHVFRDVLIIGNVFRNTFGWTYAAESRGHWPGSPYSDGQGMGGFGLNLDMASGIHAYRNIAYNNGHAGFKMSGVWRDGDIVFYNNISANSLHGFRLGGTSWDKHGSVNTQVVNNILVNNAGYGILQSDADGVYGNMMFDHNLYDGNGWGNSVWRPGDMAIYRGADPNEHYLDVADIRANTPWESHGVAGAPRLKDYDPADHDFDDGSWPDFRLTGASTNAIDRGSAALPASLTKLIDAFGVEDARWGTALDIGAFEFEIGFSLKATPSVGVVDPTGAATYIIEVSPVGGFNSPVTLVTGSASRGVRVDLAPQNITPPGSAVLTLTDISTVPRPDGLWHTVVVTGTSDGFTQVTRARLLVGGKRSYIAAAIWN